MFVNIWTAITLILSALLMGATLGHVLEMPGKLAASGPLWLTFQHTLYKAFAIAGGPIEMGAIGASAMLAWLVRRNRSLLPSVLSASALLAIGFGIWLAFTSPVNARTSAWVPGAMPADWDRWRTQWEYSHAARFLLHLIAFCILVLASIFRMPESPRKRLRPAYGPRVAHQEMAVR